MGVGCPCLPVHNNIVTPCHLLGQYSQFLGFGDKEDMKNTIWDGKNDKSNENRYEHDDDSAVTLSSTFFFSVQTTLKHLSNGLLSRVHVTE